MKRRGSRKGAKAGIKNIGNRLFPFVKAVSAPIAFMEQITAKDRQDNAGTFSSVNTTTQLKMLTNVVTGRLAGFGLFKNLPLGGIHDGVSWTNSPPQTINPAGVLNKWTNAGMIGIAYGVIGKSVNNMSRNMGLGSVVPEVSKVKSIGKSILIGGALGGFFDDHPTPTKQFQRQSQSFPMTNTMSYSTNQTYNNTQDSTGSSF